MKLTPLILVAGAFGFAAAAEATPALVAANGTARQEYQQMKFPAGHPAASETYAFYQGNFFGGQTRDPSLDKTSFHDIALALAQNLLSADYQPTRDLQSAKILLIVNWGVTTVDENPTEVLEAQDLNAARTSFNSASAAAVTKNSMTATSPWPGQLDFQISMQNTDQADIDQKIAFNANLLGFAGALKADANKDAFFQSDEGPSRTLRDMLGEPRYFIVLTACDYQTMRDSHQQKILWTVRLSTPANGATFTGVLPALAAEAARYAGRQTQSLQFDSI